MADRYILINEMNRLEDECYEKFGMRRTFEINIDEKNNYFNYITDRD